jgi:2-oxoglutarate ferredoxin oxidoreductase subunit beta
MANRNLIYLGISGDGDTASIGMGQFVHAIRRNLNMVYIVMNNGTYGLTKRQASPFMGIELGATFVGRSFSGDKIQLVPLIQAAIAHKGFALLDVMSPCVTFNNNPGSTKSYDFIREHRRNAH